jgi:hypothetical protein
MFQHDKPEHSLFASQMYQMLSFSCLNFHPEGTSTSSEKNKQTRFAQTCGVIKH